MGKLVDPVKKKKKRKRRIIIGVVIVAILAFLFWPVDDEEFDYSESRDNTEVGVAMSGSGSDNRDALAERFGSDVIRDYYSKVKGNGEDTVTLLVYMNGSNLESEAQEATEDLSEMVAGAGVSDKVNILVQTMGTKSWDKKWGISSKRTERYKLDGTGLKLVDGSLKQLDCTRTETLADFLKWGVKNYPADRYMLVFWNHGGGAIYGFGYDEWVSDESAALTIDEMRDAFKQAGVFFDFIGMDCCIMSSLEVCCAFYDYCDYTILSEDFESGLGWSYTKWIKSLYNNTSISTVDLGKQICDDMVKANVDNVREGDNSIMALIDETMVKLLYNTWKEFAYDAEDTLKSKNFSRKVLPKRGGRALPALATAYGVAENTALPSRLGFFSELLFGDDDAPTLEEYCEVDIMSAASSINSDVSELLKSAISNALVHVSYSEGDAHLTGLAVSLPYGDQNGYASMREIFSNVGMDQEYINWLEQFVYLESDNYYDYSDFDDDWYGWDTYDDYYDDDDDYFSLWDYFFGDDDFGEYGFDDCYGYYDGYDYDDGYYGDYGDDCGYDYDYYYDDYYYDDDYYDDDDGWWWLW